MDFLEMTATSMEKGEHVLVQTPEVSRVYYRHFSNGGNPLWTENTRKLG